MIKHNLKVNAIDPRQRRQNLTCRKCTTNVRVVQNVSNLRDQRLNTKFYLIGVNLEQPKM